MIKGFTLPTVIPLIVPHAAPFQIVDLDYVTWQTTQRLDLCGYVVLGSGRVGEMWPESRVADAVAEYVQVGTDNVDLDAVYEATFEGPNGSEYVACHYRWTGVAWRKVGM